VLTSGETKKDALGTANDEKPDIGKKGETGAQGGKKRMGTGKGRRKEKCHKSFPPKTRRPQKKRHEKETINNSTAQKYQKKGSRRKGAVHEPHNSTRKNSSSGRKTSRVAENPGHGVRAHKKPHGNWQNHNKRE